MSNCVNIIWKNGLGNQLFQYAYGRIKSEINQCDLTYSGTMNEWVGVNLFDYGLLNETHKVKKYNNQNILLNIDYNKVQALDLENPHFYSEHINDIKSWFTNQDDKNMDDLVVHLRLGDNGPNIHTPFEWYKKAIEDNEIEFHKLFLITDGSDSEDARKFKSYYDAEIPSSVNVETNQDWKKYLHETMFDFNFIRKFDKILFSNSTFSWWASVLSDASHIWFNKEWQPNHYHGKIRLGETNYSKWNPIIPFSLKEK